MVLPSLLFPSPGSPQPLLICFCGYTLSTSLLSFSTLLLFLSPYAILIPDWIAVCRRGIRINQILLWNLCWSMRGEHPFFLDVFCTFLVLQSADKHAPVMRMPVLAAFSLECTCLPPNQIKCTGDGEGGFSCSFFMQTKYIEGFVMRDKVIVVLVLYWTLWRQHIWMLSILEISMIWTVF